MRHYCTGLTTSSGPATVSVRKIRSDRYEHFLKMNAADRNLFILTGWGTFGAVWDQFSGSRGDLLRLRMLLRLHLNSDLTGAAISWPIWPPYGSIWG